VLPSLPLQGIGRQLSGKVLEGQDLNAILCAQYGPMGVDNDPAPYALKVGDGARLVGEQARGGQKPLVRLLSQQVDDMRLKGRP
jgi:hypothetical protein